MGAWGPDPFHNDTAADYAATLRALPTPADRAARMRQTLTDFLAAHDLHLARVADYELDYRVEEAVAAAAFLADRHADRRHFTDDVFAQGVDPATEEIRPPMELTRPTADLLALATAAVDKLLELLRYDDSADQVRDVLGAIRAALTSRTGPPAVPAPGPLAVLHLVYHRLDKPGFLSPATVRLDPGVLVAPPAPDQVIDLHDGNRITLEAVVHRLPLHGTPARPVLRLEGRFTPDDSWTPKMVVKFLGAFHGLSGVETDADDLARCQTLPCPACRAQRSRAAARES